MGCGGALRASSGGHPVRPRRRLRWVWVLLLASAVLYVAHAATSPPPAQRGQQAASAPVGTATSAPPPASASASLPPPHATHRRRPGPAAPPSPVPPPTWTPKATDTPLPTETPASTPTSPPDPAKQADLRNLIGKADGIQQMCLDAGKIANTSFSAVAQGTGDSVQAYTDADNAQTACDNAKSLGAALIVPDSLSEYKMGELSTDMFAWAQAAGNFYNDYKKVLQNNSDIASASDAKKMATDMQQYSDAAAILMVGAAMSLKVNIASITPVAPQ